MESSPPTKEILMKMQELEESQKRLMQEMSKLKVSTGLRQRSHSGKEALGWRKSGANSVRKKKNRIHDSISLRGTGPSAGKFTHKQYLNIVQSMGQSVHAFDLKMRIIFW
ncbi:PAS domain-containing protein tyrosine kinase family protein [Raphanus sativus]|nr:PAS domain-containing protein tyrosine kinase family protein [Raphanus sativus]